MAQTRQTSTGHSRDYPLAVGVYEATPYYQEQMARLSLNERKTVRALADLDHSCTVKDLAAATGIDQRSISKTISDLRLKGWVRQRTGRRAEASSVNRELDDLIRTELGYEELSPFHVRRYLEDSLVTF